MANKLNKNQELLESFSKYMAENPSMRFWQALRNWSGAGHVYYTLPFNAETKDTFWANDEDELKRIKEFHDARQVRQPDPVSAD